MRSCGATIPIRLAFTVCSRSRAQGAERLRSGCCRNCHYVTSSNCNFLLQLYDGSGSLAEKGNMRAQRPRPASNRHLPCVSSPQRRERELSALGYSTHAPVSVVREGRLDFGPCVHHKGPLADDWLIDRLAAEEQDLALLQRLDCKQISFAPEDRKLRGPLDFARPQFDLAIEDEKRSGPSSRDSEFLPAASFQADIP